MVDNEVRWKDGSDAIDGQQQWDLQRECKCGFESCFVLFSFL